MIANRLIATALGIVMIAGVSAGANAQTVRPANPAEQTFFDLQSAIVAFERCYRPLNPATNTARNAGRTFRFNTEQYSQLTERVLQQVPEIIGAGRSLELLQAAKISTHTRVAVRGCNNSAVQEALELYNTQLASAVTM